MRFVYTYRSSDGQRHTAEIEAESRDAAFAKVRTELGIKPIKVMAAGGQDTQDNRDAQDRRRVPVLGVVGVLGVLAILTLLAGGAWWWMTGRNGGGEAAEAMHSAGEDNSWLSPKKGNGGVLESNVVELKPGVRVATPRPRMHLDVSAVTNLDEAFKFESERYLVRFACPGAAVPSDLPQVPDDLYDALESDILIQPDDSRDTVNLKRIVAGLKEEARRHLSVGAGLGDWTEFLVGRQRMEAEYRERIIGNFADDVDEMHRRLRAMGFE